ncbi:hypothetical protein B0H13DRAFT_1856480 [Mycena leptocephala]|nr:hypothetical protein B0H13DRAFT_1856480 [Mycena leptocephala]
MEYNLNYGRYSNAAYLLGLGPMPPQQPRDYAVANMNNVLDSGFFDPAHPQYGEPPALVQHQQLATRLDLDVHIPCPVPGKSDTVTKILTFDIKGTIPNDFLDRVCATMGKTRDAAELGWKSCDAKKKEAGDLITGPGTDRSTPWVKWWPWVVYFPPCVLWGQNENAELPTFLENSKSVSEITLAQIKGELEIIGPASGSIAVFLVDDHHTVWSCPTQHSVPPENSTNFGKDLTQKKLRTGTKKLALAPKWFNIAHSIPSLPEIPQIFGGILWPILRRFDPETITAVVGTEGASPKFPFSEPFDLPDRFARISPSFGRITLWHTAIFWILCSSLVFHCPCSSAQVQHHTIFKLSPMPLGHSLQDSSTTLKPQALSSPLKSTSSTSNTPKTYCPDLVALPFKFSARSPLLSICTGIERQGTELAGGSGSARVFKGASSSLLDRGTGRHNHIHTRARSNASQARRTTPRGFCTVPRLRASSPAPETPPSVSRHGAPPGRGGSSPRGTGWAARRCGRCTGASSLPRTTGMGRPLDGEVDVRDSVIRHSGELAQLAGLAPGVPARKHFPDVSFYPVYSPKNSEIVPPHSRNYLVVAARHSRKPDMEGAFGHVQITVGPITGSDTS